MVIDTSAIIAIMNNEPERRRFNELIEAARGLSANEELLARPYAAEVEAARLRYPLKTELSEAPLGGRNLLSNKPLFAMISHPEQSLRICHAHRHR